MNRHVANYTLVRLLPQADAGEFANIGVVLACPDRKFFDFRLIKRYTRVTQFFEEFARPLFPKVRSEVQAELDYLKQRVLAGQAGPGGMMAVMTELARPREAMIRYAPLRTVLTDDPAADLERLLARFVARDGQEVQRSEEHTNRHPRTHKNGRSAKDFWVGNNTRRFHRGPPFSAGLQCSAGMGPQALAAGHCRQRFTALLRLLDATWPDRHA